MNSMNEVFYIICAAAVTAALFTSLIPSERYSSQIRLLIACCFIVVVANAVGNIGFSDISGASEVDTDYNDYSVTLREMTAKETAAALRARIKDVLASEDIFPEKIYIAVNISDSGSISISEIRLVSVNEADRDRALTLMHTCVGFGTRVIVE